jgi:hypothetical protein
MSKILFKRKITNDIVYEDGTKKETSDYSKHYTTKKWFFGILFHEHDFVETIHSKEGTNAKNKVGFKNGD